MKSSDKVSFIRQGSTVLGIIGTLLILTFVLDFGIRLFAAEFETLTWQQGFLNELMDRGITPLLGLSFIFVGTLLKTSTDAPASPVLIKDGRFWLFVISSLFGLLYLILIPIHFNTTGQILGDTITQFEQEAARAEQGIQAQKDQLKAIASSGNIDTLLANEQLPPAQKELLTQVKDDPTVVDKRAEEELGKINAQKDTATSKANQEATLVRLRSELRSLLLSVAFAALGWTGLRNVLKG